MVNNSNYGMTGGQLSATTPGGKITSTSEFGNPERAFDLCGLVDAAGANYVARGTVYHVAQLDKLIQDGIMRKGFSFIEVVSPCPTHFGRRNHMGDGVAMMKYLKEKGVTPSQYEMLSEEEKKEFFRIGKLTDRSEPDYNSQCEKIRKICIDAQSK